MLVNGTPLHRTNIALDPKCPVRISEVDRLFREQSKYQVTAIRMGEMMDGVHALAQKIRACHQAGSRILTFDCVSQEDLDLIADACIESGEKIIGRFYRIPGQKDHQTQNGPQAEPYPGRRGQC